MFSLFIVKVNLTGMKSLVNGSTWSIDLNSNNSKPFKTEKRKILFLHFIIIISIAAAAVLLKLPLKICHWSVGDQTLSVSLNQPPLVPWAV